MLRKINTILSIALIAIFLVHGILGSFMMAGVGHTAGRILAWIGVGLLAVHLVFGIILTVQTIRAGRSAGGAAYLRENSLFWTRRASGLAILILAICHIGLFGKERYGTYVLFEFTTWRMIIQLLLVAALFIHIFVNIRPMLVSLGVLRHKERKTDVFLILSILVLFMAGATILYYIRWQVL